MLTQWTGVFTALWTPTDARGRLLRSGLRQNLAFLQGKGISGLLPLGSTGEFLHLDLPARKKFLSALVRDFDPGRLMVNVSDIRPAVVAELGRFAKQLGAGAISLLPPYFFSTDQEDLREWFIRAAAASDLPLFLYNFPERTGTRIDLETIASVADAVPVLGVKQSGAEFTYHSGLVELGRKKNFIVLTGSDTRLPEAVALGVSGCVSGLANAVPELVVAAFEQACRRDVSETQTAASKLSEMATHLQTVPFPLHVAAAMEARGLIVGTPKSVVSAGTQRRYADLVAKLQACYSEWKLT